MGIVDDDIAKVREATDLVAVVSEHLQLKRVGQRWVGLCPFHNEKSPSFSINQQLGFYHCFGCQQSGDAISFVREIEGLDFVGAVERLAAKAGVTLTYTSANEGRQRHRRTQLVEAVADAVEFYHHRLLEAPDAGAARAYLRERGIDGDDARRYKIGWAPDEWDQLTRTLKRPPQHVIDAGLGFKNRRNRMQDTFRARILFPIYDVNGDPVGFGGRKMPDAEGPKYKNSSESPIYSKSRLLYGLNWAKEEIVKHDEVIVCEGYTDVIGYAKAGLARAVATCGTALTEDHVKILKRFAKRIVLSFDADAAGQAAADRFYAWEKTYDVDVRVASLPPGVDPADLAATDPAALRAAVEDAQPFLSFRVARVLDGGDLSTLEGRARAADAAAALALEHPNPLVRDQYLVQIAQRCQLDLDQLRATASGNPPRSAQRGALSRVSNQDSSDQRGADPEILDLTETVEIQMLRVAVHHPDLVPNVVDEMMFADPTHREIFEALLQADTLFDAVALCHGHSQEILQRILVDNVDPIDESGAAKLAGRLVDERATRELRRLKDLARATDDPTMGRQVAEMHHGLAQLRAANWDLTAAAGLVAWLSPAEQT